MIGVEADQILDFLTQGGEPNIADVDSRRVFAVITAASPHAVSQASG
jgi:hypothetical protein